MRAGNDGPSKAPGPLETQLNSGLGPARLTSQALLGTAGELVIIHAGREYRLRLTQNGKLILTA